MISKKWKNLVIVMDGRPWVRVPADNAADDYRLEQMMHSVLTAGEVFCRLGMRRDVPERTSVVLLPLPECPHNNISLPTTSDPSAVCADCGADVPTHMRVSIFASLTGGSALLGYLEPTDSCGSINDKAAWGKCSEWVTYHPDLRFVRNG